MSVQTQSPTPTTASFVLETQYRDETKVVADGAMFPSGRVVVDWRTDGGFEVLQGLDALYSKFSTDPRVMWEQPDGTYSEAEPPTVVE